METSQNNHNRSTDSHQSSEKRDHADDIILDIVDTVVCCSMTRRWEYLRQTKHIWCICYIRCKGKNTAKNPINKVSEDIFCVHAFILPYCCWKCKKYCKKKTFWYTPGVLKKIMQTLILSSAVILIVLVLLQVRDGGLNVAVSSTLQAPIERRGPAKTLHISTILVSIIFVGSCIVTFLS